jgi:hypothetical protein
MSDAKIVTEFVYPPIPDRRFDWSAIDDNPYDGADDSSCPIGHGATEQEAIDDLPESVKTLAEAKRETIRGAML